MVEVWLPYGSSEIPVRVPEERLIDILRIQRSPNLPDIAAEAKQLIETNRRLQEMAQQAKRVCIALGPCANPKLAGELINALLQTVTRNSSGTTTILSTPSAPNLDRESFSDTPIKHHLPESSGTSSVTEFKGDFTPQLNSDFLSADLRIIVGEVKPHNFLKYSGLSDMVFPGLASNDTIQHHLSNRNRFTVLDLYKERLNIANSLGRTMALGVILDSDRDPVRVALGSISDVLSTTQDSLEETHLRTVTKMADVVVMGAGGTPQDETLLEAVETLPAGLTALKRNGALIVAAECGKGHGDTEFYAWCQEGKEARYLETRLRHHFSYDGFKAAFLRRTLEAHRIYLISTVADHYVEKVFGMKAARTVNAALQTVQRTLGSDSTVSVIPDASRVIIRRQTIAQ